MTLRVHTAAALGLGLACITILAASMPKGAAAAQPEAQPGQQPEDMGAMLMNGLRETPGCLGVEAADMMSGKKSIIAWFKDKNAVERWYYSDVHERIMADLVENEEGHEHKPLEHVTDENTPVMVIATITPSDEPQIEGISLPISQISIELFAPLPGGVYFGGRLSPETFVAPEIRDYTGE